MSVYTVAQAARAAGVSPQTVQNWIRRGTLKTFRYNGRKYIEHDDLMARRAWLNKQSPDGASA